MDPNTYTIPAPIKGRKRKYAFNKLEPGQRLKVSKEDRTSAIQSAYLYGKSTHRKFCVRTEPDGVYIYRES